VQQGGADDVLTVETHSVIKLTLLLAVWLIWSMEDSRASFIFQ
jgi:hypothetical protein